jgi:hypothetical protein
MRQSLWWYCFSICFYRITITERTLEDIHMDLSIALCVLAFAAIAVATVVIRNRRTR